MRTPGRWHHTDSLDVPNAPSPALRGFPDSAAARLVGTRLLGAATILLPDPQQLSETALVAVTDDWDPALLAALSTRLYDGKRISPLSLVEFVPNGVLGRCAQVVGARGPIFAIAPQSSVSEDVRSVLDNMVPDGVPPTALAVSSDPRDAHVHLFRWDEVSSHG